MDQRNLQHLYHRAGFGLRPQQLIAFQKQNLKWNVDNLFDKSKEIVPMHSGLGLNLIPQALNNISQEKQQELIKQQRQQLTILNQKWINRMVNEESQLRERMTFFWHNHFACRLKRVHTAESHYNVLHKHALGNFGELLKNISKDAGMLRFLNNQQNRKRHPNENFAREVMELFTLGRDREYTEFDIQEAARAFTGWASLPSGEFVFRRRQHDFGIKEFMGKRGNFDGDDILNILLENRGTATHIVEKIYKYFIHEELNTELVKQWSKDFYESNYEISPLLRGIFNSSHFYEKKHIGTRVKSPIDFLISTCRMLNLEIGNENNLLPLQQVLGQVLFLPPNVAGWGHGLSWIDSSSLMTRLSIPKAIIFSKHTLRKNKRNFSDKEDGIRNLGGKKTIQYSNIDWKPLLKLINNSQNKNNLQVLGDFFLQVAPPFEQTDLFDWIKKDNEELALQKSVSLLMSTPEFQMN